MTPVAEQREHTLAQRMLSAQAFWVTMVLLAMCAVMSVLQPQAFASIENFYNITRNFAFIGIMALGMTTVVVTGGIDLSVGSVMGLAAIVAGLVLQDARAVVAGDGRRACHRLRRRRGERRADRLAGPAAVRGDARHAVDRPLARRRAVAEQDDL